MEIKQCYLTKNDCYKQGKTMVPKGIVVHSTGANNPYIKRYVQPDNGIIGKNQYNNDLFNQMVNRGCLEKFSGGR